MNDIGIMQGRLTQTLGRGVQFFPFDTWEEEFEIASTLNLKHIEYIFDLDRYEENPLWSNSGIKQIKNKISQTGVNIRYITADFFMRRPFFRVPENIRKENIEVLKKLIERTKEIGAHDIEIPLLDNSSINDTDEEKLLVASLEECLSVAAKHGVTISFETDLHPDRYIPLLNQLSNHTVRVVYDTGNSASLGYQCDEEIQAFSDKLSNVHIKDRELGGGSTKLGEGATDFPKIFNTLKTIGYHGDFTLQAARGKDGTEVETTRSQIDFIKQYLTKYDN